MSSLYGTAFVSLLLAFAGVHQAPPFEPLMLSDTVGRKQQVLRAGSRKPTVLLFLGHDCPISNKYSPEINRMVSEYRARVVFYVIYPDPGVKPADARKHAADFGYRCPALLDPRHLAVKRAGVSITPEAAVFDARGRRAYRGRIDDTYIDFGKRRDAPTRRDLRLAIQSVLEGKKVAPAVTRAVGCFIPGRIQEEKRGE